MPELRPATPRLPESVAAFVGLARAVYGPLDYRSMTYCVRGPAGAVVPGGTVGSVRGVVQGFKKFAADIINSSRTPWRSKPAPQAPEEGVCRESPRELARTASL